MTKIQKVFTCSVLCAKKNNSNSALTIRSYHSRSPNSQVVTIKFKVYNIMQNYFRWANLSDMTQLFLCDFIPYSLDIYNLDKAGL